jgi:hypothetical protein
MMCSHSYILVTADGDQPTVVASPVQQVQQAGLSSSNLFCISFPASPAGEEQQRTLLVLVSTVLCQQAQERLARNGGEVGAVSESMAEAAGPWDMTQQ